MLEAVAQWCSEISFAWKHLYLSLLLIKLQAEACKFIKKETVAQVFSTETGGKLFNWCQLYWYISASDSYKMKLHIKNNLEIKPKKLQLKTIK